MLKKLVRIVFTLVGIAIGYGVFLLINFLFDLGGILVGFGLATPMYEILTGIVFSVLFGFVFFKISPSLIRQDAKIAKTIEKDLQSVSTNDMLMGTAGLITGLIIAFLISRVYEGIQVFYLDVILTIVTYVILSYLGIIIATKKGKDIASVIIAARKSGGTAKPKSKQGEAAPKILDTSVIIDGRIADIMKTGFIEGSIVIPEFVLVELRHIADSSDSLKRNRGRRGLDVLNKIQTEYGIEIYNTETDKSLSEIPEVDVKLLKLAQIMNGKVVTNDFNLNKVASIKGVDVLNINELANMLKPVVLPGEDMTLFLVKEGKESNQGLAYLDDGTMIVVEEGKKFIGQTVKVSVTSVLQTSAGRMIFAKIKHY